MTTDWGPTLQPQQEPLTDNGLAQPEIQQAIDDLQAGAQVQAPHAVRWVQPIAHEVADAGIQTVSREEYTPCV